MGEGEDHRLSHRATTRCYIRGHDYKIPMFKRVICTLIFFVGQQAKSNSQFPCEFYSNSNEFKSRSIFESSFKIGCDSVQVINMEVSPNDPIYLLARFHIFLRPLYIYSNLIPISVWMEKIKEKSETLFSFLTGPAR
jgi:hypothetical protein